MSRYAEIGVKQLLRPQRRSFPADEGPPPARRLSAWERAEQIAMFHGWNRTRDALRCLEKDVLRARKPLSEVRRALLETFGLECTRSDGAAAKDFRASTDQLFGDIQALLGP